MTATRTIRPTTHDAIINAAIATLAENPGASMNDIAKRAGVGRATVYRNYKTRDELIVAIQARSIKETDAAVLAALEEDMTALQTLEAMFVAIIPLGDRFHFLSTEFAYDDELKKKYQRELDWLTGLVHALKSEGVIADDIPESWATEQLNQIIWTAWREVGEGRVAPAAAPALALRTFTRGMSEPTGE